MRSIKGVFFRIGIVNTSFSEVQLSNLVEKKSDLMGRPFNI